MVRALKDVVKQVVELDKAFTHLKIVTQATNEQLAEMKSTYISLAKEMNVSLSTVTDAAEAWLRTGMNAADATDALRASIVLSTIAFMDGSTATQNLVAAQKAYGLSAQELMGVVGQLSILDTKAATTAADLGEALSMSASSAGLAGIELDKYLAILATTSETTQQSASTIGNSWKTILARLQQVKLGAAFDEEGQDISNVDKLLKEYGIDLMATTKNLEDMEALLDLLGKNWKNYTASQKSEIATVVAGVRQRDKLIATLNNYDRVLELTVAQENSEIVAQEKMQAYMESTEGKINKLKTAWTELADATVSSDLVEWFISAGTSMEELATKAGGLVPVLVELGAAFAALKIGGAFGAIVGGLVAGGAAIYQISQATQSKWIEQNITKQKQETDKLVSSQEQERKKVNELMKEYISLLSVKDRTEEQDKKLTDISEKLAESLNLEAKNIKEVSDSFKSYSEAYTKFMIDSLQTTLLGYVEDSKELSEKISVLKEYQDKLELKVKNPSVYAGSSAIADELQLFLEKLFHGKEVKEGEKALAEYEAEIRNLENQIKITTDQGTKMLDLIGSTQGWDRSEEGAKRLKQSLDEIDSILGEIKKKRDDETDAESKSKLDDLISLYESFSEVIKSQYETFVSTDHILTEYYDKQLSALKEQKELEDELAKQKEKQEKLESAELKKQEALLEVEKARAELAKAREKRIQVFRMGKGLVYEEDTESIANAQEGLTKALDNYASAVKDYDKVFSELYGTATEQLISAVNELEKVYGYVLLQNPAVREYFQTPEKREEFMGLSPAGQLEALFEFLKGTKGEEDVKSKVYSEVAGMGAKAVEEFGLTGVIPDNEKYVSDLGVETRESVFGKSTDSGSVAGYISEKENENYQKVLKKAQQASIVGGYDWDSFLKLKTKDGEIMSELYDKLTDSHKDDIRQIIFGKRTYHTGGIVGEEAFKSDSEMYAKLLKGEIVLPQNKFNNIIDKVRETSNSNSMVMNIGNISLPNVTDTDSFVNELQKISYSQA